MTLSRKLDRIIELLEKLVGEGNETDVPPVDVPEDWIAPYAPPQLTPQPPPFEPTTTCPKCGMQFKGMMGYVCQNADCPMGCGPTMC